MKQQKVNIAEDNSKTPGDILPSKSSSTLGNDAKRGTVILYTHTHTHTH